MSDFLSRDGIFLTPRSASYLFKKATKAQGDEAAFKRMVLQDVTKYKGLSLLQLHINFDRGGSWSDQVLLTAGQEAWLDHNDEKMLNFGEINGKHSEIMRRFSDVCVSSEQDPYKINRILQGKGARGLNHALDCALEDYTNWSDEAEAWAQELYRDMTGVEISRKIIRIAEPKSTTSSSSSSSPKLKKQRVEVEAEILLLDSKNLAWLRKQEEVLPGGWKIACTWVEVSEFVEEYGEDNCNRYGPLDTFFRKKFLKI